MRSSSARHVRHQRLTAMAGAILMPLLIACSFLWATWNSSDRLHEQQAAIVNLDEGARVGNETVRLGQTYALQLRNQTGPNFTWRYGVSVAEAQAGLASGRYAAAVVIPAGFSRTLTGAGEQGDSATLVVERSPVTGVSDQIVLNTLSQAATQGLATGVASKYLDNIFVASAQLGAGLAETSAQAQEVATGVGRVAENARTAAQQAKGLTEQARVAAAQSVGLSAAAAAEVAAQKAGAASQGAAAQAGTGIAAGSDAQRKAINQISTSTGALATSASGAKKSSADVAAKANGAVAQGDSAAKQAAAVSVAAAANKAAAASYAGAVKDALAKQADLQETLGAANTALDGYASSVDTVAAGVQTITKAVSAASAPTSDPQPALVPSSAEQLRASAVTLREIAAQLESSKGGVPKKTIDSADNAAATAARLSTDLAALLDELAKRSITVTCEGHTEEFCAGYRAGAQDGYDLAFERLNKELGNRSSDFAKDVRDLEKDTATVSTSLADLGSEQTAAAANLRTIADTLETIADQPETSAGTVQQVAEVLADKDFSAALGSLDSGATDTRSSLATVSTTAAANQKALATISSDSDVAKSLTTGANTMSATAATQAEVVATLKTQLAAMNQGMTALASVLTGLDTEAADLSKTTTATDQGAVELARQVTSLNTQLKALQTAAQGSSQQAADTESRAKALQRQISALQQSGTTVASSVQGVSSQASSQAEAASQVVQAVKRNQSQVPTAASSEERKRLTEVINAPISTTESNANANLGWTSMLMAIALWCGAVAFFTVRLAVSQRARESAEPSVRLLVREMVPTGSVAVGQAIVLSLVGQSVMHLAAGPFLGMFGVLVLGGLVALAINHALRAFLGSIGIVLSVGMATLTFVSVVTSAFPVTLDNLRRLVPTTPLVDALRSVMSGAPGLGSNLWHLAAWLAGGVLFSALAILRARTGPETRVPTVVEQPESPTE